VNNKWSFLKKKRIFNPFAHCEQQVEFLKKKSEYLTLLLIVNNKWSFLKKNEYLTLLLIVNNKWSFLKKKRIFNSFAHCEQQVDFL
jgi:hypothetical protein